MKILETARLILRELTTTDSRFIIGLVNSPGWLHFIGDRNIRNEEQAIAYLKNGPIKSYQENGFGLWLVELKESKTAIGMCGILKRPTLEHPDIGFAFLPEHEGKGYAHEAAEATLVCAHEALQMGTVYAITDPGNTRSIALLDKIGMQFSTHVPSPTGDKELLLYTT